MALITYADKDNSLPTTDVRRLYRDVDANEVKNVVNANAALLPVVWTDTVAGIVERSTNTEANNIVTRAIAGSSNASNSDARTPSEVGLVQMLISFTISAWTWAAKQIFTQAPTFSSVTASQFLKVDSNKDLISVAAATQAEMLTGTDTTKPLTPAALESKRSLKRIVVSISAGTMNIPYGLKEEVRFENTTAIVANFTVTFSDEANMEVSNGVVFITGTIAITMPSSVVMEKIDTRWNNGTKILTVIGGTAEPFILSFNRVSSSKIELRASHAIHAS